MLTGDLLRLKVKGSDLVPSYVDPDKPALREFSDQLVEVFREAVEERWSRALLDEAIDGVIGDSKDHKLLKGLAKVLFDRSEFEVGSEERPADLRMEVFLRARQRGPLDLEPGPLKRVVAQDILVEIAQEKGTTPEAIAKSLYADRHEEQQITSCNAESGEWLLHRYNLALVQAALLHATSVQIWLEKPSPTRVRQLFRYIKFHQLMHSAHPVGQDLEIRLDGPLSLFGPSTRYGMQLASFFPAVLLQEKWRLEATVLWTKAKFQKRMEITPKDDLQPILADTGTWEPREHTWFVERFQALDTPWKLSAHADPIHLGGRAILFPDFTLEKDGRVARLEIIGYWRKDWLMRRIEWLERYGPGNLILAVSKKLHGGKEALSAFPGAVIEFSEIIPPKAVIQAAELIATRVP